MTSQLFREWWFVSCSKTFGTSAILKMKLVSVRMMRSSVLAITVMLVYSAMALPSTSALPPLKLAYNPNFYDQLHKIECPPGLGLYTVTSEHSNSKEDRIFTYTCRDVAPKATVSCYWTGYVNNYDEPMFFQCPANQYLGGTESRHDNGKEDRQFKFQCCSAGFTSKDCYLTDYKNNFDAKFTATAPNGETFAGMHSYHSNHHEDRRFKFYICEFE